MALAINPVAVPRASRIKLIRIDPKVRHAASRRARRADCSKRSSGHVTAGTAIR